MCSSDLGVVGGVYSFYDLWIGLRDLQRKENGIRLRLLPGAMKFEAMMEGCGRVEGDVGAKLYEYCRKALKGKVGKGVGDELSRAEFDEIMELLRRLRHPAKDGVGLVAKDWRGAEGALRRYGFFE